MSFTVNVKMKKMGKEKKNGTETVPFLLEEKPDTVRELISGLVRISVRDYNERKDQGQILSWLSMKEIKEQAETGKVSFGLRSGKDADEESAVENAVQCFEDGIYRIFKGEEELISLDQQLEWNQNPVITLVRLTMLSGW